MDRFRMKNYTRETAVIREFMKKFGDGCLNLDQFSKLCEESFDCSCISADLKTDYIQRIFHLIDVDQDDKLDAMEWEMAWSFWLKQVLSPVTALLIIDVQNDFINGSLSLSGCPAGQDGAAILSTINSLQDDVHFDVVVYSKDWHPDDHISFIENVHTRHLHHSSKVLAKDACVTDTVIFAGPPVTEQVLWPAHCVQGTKGAALHRDLKILDTAYTVNKGTQSDVDSYSAFWDNNKQSQTELVQILARHKVSDVYVCGLAYDVCVGSTALDAVAHGFRTVLLEDACRGVCLQGIDNMRLQLVRSGVLIASSEEVSDLVTAKKRPLTLALKAAENYSLARKLAQSKSP